MTSRERSSKQNSVMKARREAWLKEHGPCCECGSSENLEVDHVDKATKFTHRIWSYCDAKRTAELDKCRVLCRTCHQKRHAEENKKHGYAQYRKGCRCAFCLHGWEQYKVYANRKRRERIERERMGLPIGRPGRQPLEASHV